MLSEREKEEKDERGREKERNKNRRGVVEREVKRPPSCNTKGRVV